MKAPASAWGGQGPVVAFQGEHGAFSEEALLDHFAGRARPLPCRGFGDVGDAVRRGKADFGLLPVENTLAGSVQASHDVLMEGGVTITGEVILRIRHFLMGVSGTREDEVERVLSHPVALAQCTRYLRERPRIQAMAVHDTAGAAREVSQRGDPAVAAIAPFGAAARYGLAVLAGDLQDRPDNQTRFYVVRSVAPPLVRSEEGERGLLPEAEGSSGTHESEIQAFRTVVLLELKDRPGSLLRVLAPFSERGIDLARIESRPAGEPWRYRFLLELRLDARTPPGRAALQEVERESTRLRVLGSFPMGRGGMGRGVEGAEAGLGP